MALIISTIDSCFDNKTISKDSKVPKNVRCDSVAEMFGHRQQAQALAHFHTRSATHPGDTRAMSVLTLGDTCYVHRSDTVPQLSQYRCARVPKLTRTCARPTCPGLERV